MLQLRGWLVVLALALLVGGLYGQQTVSDSTDTPAKFKGMLPPNWGKLGLSDDQKQKIYRVQAEYAAKIAELERQIQALREQERTEMAKFLTDAQKTKLKELTLGKDANK